MQIKPLFIALLTGLTVSGAAQAALHDRGGGLIYDDVLNVTWLQDANYAKTSGYDADGRMNWGQAVTWADNLVYGGYDDWRLPTLQPINGTSFNLDHNYNGTSDRGYNITSTNSELSYMYYVNLGLTGYFNPDLTVRTDWGIFGNGTLNGTDYSSYGQNDVGLIVNLQATVYVFGTKYVSDNDVYTDAPFGFYMDDGAQGTFDFSSTYYAWAVRSGDVAAVPEPETYALMLAGLGLVGVAARRQRG